MGGRGGSSGGKRESGHEKSRRYRQAETRVNKSVKSYQKRIFEHQGYIKNPKQKYGDKWDTFPQQRKDAERRHWQHEIDTFRRNIEKEQNKLKELENGNQG